MAESKQNQNSFLEYYTQHSISPEHLNIEDIEGHYAKRKKLYRQCGIPEIAFRDAEMLEVGPGGGYNTLAFFHWNCKHIDLVEANPQGVLDMKSLFREKKIPENRYNIFETPIEKYVSDRKYDIIIAEGFLPALYNQNEVLDKLKELANDNGIIVVTCTGKMDYFIEILKRLVGVTLAQEISSYEEKVKYLVKIFEPQLKTLKGISRLPEDWVMDVILSPAQNNGMELNLAQVIQYMGEEFDVLGASPHMFTDYSWGKNIWYDYKKDYIEQFEKKRLSLLMADMPEIILPPDKVNMWVKYFEEIRDAEKEYEDTFNVEKIKEIVEIINSMETYLEEDFDKEFINVIHEIKELLSNILQNKEIQMENYSHFFTAFGRTQQYISFVKK